MEKPNRIHAYEALEKSIQHKKPTDEQIDIIFSEIHRAIDNGNTSVRVVKDYTYKDDDIITFFGNIGYNVSIGHCPDLPNQCYVFDWSEATRPEKFNTPKPDGKKPTNE